MVKKSWRHHYLPVFYLKGFVKESNTFKVFNVLENKFIKNGKNFSPESYFFEKNGNTIYIADTEDDSLESYYSHFDNKISKLFNKINSSTYQTNFNVTDNDMPALNHFVSLMYWRCHIKKMNLNQSLKEEV